MADSTEQQDRVLVGDLIIDPGKRQVRRGNEVLDVPKLSFELLLALIEKAPNVVDQEDLIRRVWADRVVSPETVTQRVKLLRQAIGDDANAPRYIGLARGKGYRLLAPVETLPPDDRIGRNLLAELGRRRVLQAALVYAAIAWSITEVVSFLLEAIPVFPVWTKTLVAILFVVGFPVAMFLAWRFDIGPHGIRREAATTTEGRLAIAGAITLLIGATAGLFYLIYPQVAEEPAPALSALTRGNVIPETNTIAVMPFVNIGANPDDLYLSEGLGDELRDQLGRIGGLKVAARSSSVMFRDMQVDAVSVAERLRVRRLIEGTLRRSGDQLFIAVHIIDGITGFQEWSYTYDRADGDLLAIQQEIAQQVVGQVLPELDETAVAQTRASPDASAYESLLLARHYFQQVQEAPVIDLGLLTRAIDLYRQATIADPNSALAHSRLGAALLYLGDVAGAEQPIFRALSLNSELSEVQNTLGLYYWMKFLPGSGEAHLKAIELDPNNSDALEKYGKWLWHQQYTDQVEPYFLRAAELDPMSLTRFHDLGHFYGMSDHRDKALDVAEHIRSRFRGAEAMMALARIHEMTGDLDEAIGLALQARELAPDDPTTSWLISELYARIGDFEAAEAFEDTSTAFNILYWARRYDEMISLGQDLVLEQPNQVQIWFGLARAYAATGQYDLVVYTLSQQGLPDNVFVDARRANGMEALVTLADAHYELGDVELAREYANWGSRQFALLRDSGAETSWWPSLYQACLLSILGDDDEALQTLERVKESNGLLWYPMLMDAPCFRRLSAEPRYQSVVQHYENRLRELRERLPDTLTRMQAEQISISLE